MKTQTQTQVVKASCGNGGGCAVQPYILPYCGISNPKLAKQNA